MPHVDRCLKCDVQLEFVRDFVGAVAGSDDSYDLQEWRCRICGDTRTTFKADWPEWFYRSFEEEAEWMRDNGWYGPAVTKLKDTIKKGKYIPAAQRAGTKLAHKTGQVYKVYEQRDGKRFETGSIDPTQRVYQLGSTKRPGHVDKKDGLSGLVYWKLRVVGFGLGEWKTVVDSGDVDFIELVDMGAGKCYRIPFEAAVAVGYEYTGERGKRFGIPLEAFDVYDADWNVLKEGTVSAKRRKGRQVAGQTAIDVDELPL
jgi:hypothetical protein